MFEVVRASAPWAGILPALSIGILIRYFARPFLARRWPTVAQRPAAPYYAAFTLGLAACAVALLASLDIVAQFLAMVSYCILALGAVIELVDAIRGSNGARQ